MNNMDFKDIIIIALLILAIVLIVLFMYTDEAYKEVKKQKDNIWKLYKIECDRNIEELKRDILRDDIEELELPW